MKALIIIPTYNEKEVIGDIIREVLALPYGFDILIVDDNSPDGTGKIVKNLSETNPRIHLLQRPKKEGLGPAYLAGFSWGLNKAYDLFFEMDADFSHRPEYLHDFMKEIDHADLVIGSRYISGVNVINWPLKRLLISYGANCYARIITGMPVRDTTSGFKCFRRKVLETINLSNVTSVGYAFQIEVTMRANVKGFRLKEIPIVFYDRAKGTSKMSFSIAWEAAWVVWKLRIQKALGIL